MHQHKEGNMTDFSIKGKAVSSSGYDKTDESRYSKLKAEYKSFLVKSKKSDFVNSPIFIEKQLEMLNKLEQLAEEENLQDEIKDIKAEKEALQKKAETSAQEFSVSGYYMPIMQGQKDEYTPEELAALFNSDGNNYHINNFAKQYTNEEGTIPKNIFQASKIMAAAGIKPNFISQILNNIKVSDDNSSDAVNLNACAIIAELKANGFDDEDLTFLAKTVNQNYEDTEILKQSIFKMKKANISAETIAELAKILSVKSPDGESMVLSPKGVDSIIRVKKNLETTRENEKSERNNPINQLGVMKFMLNDKDMIIMKKNEAIYISPTEGETYRDAQKEYNEIITRIEENMLVDFARKYKSQNGEIDSKYLRVISALRRTGVAYPQIFDMMDYCINNDGKINSERLSAITSLKTAGALGADISGILDSCGTDKEGHINKENLQNACDLTAAVIGGEEVSALLEDSAKNANAKELFIYFSQFFEDKTHLIELSEMIKTPDGEIDSNAVGVLFNLPQNKTFYENDELTEQGFLDILNKILETAKNSDTGVISDNAAGICAIMSQNNMSAKDIETGLNLCRDKTGSIDYDLSEILWNLCLENSDIDDITNVINSCKNSKGEVNHKITKALLNNRTES